MASDKPKRDRMHPTIEAANLLPGLEEVVLTQMLAQGTLTNLQDNEVFIRHGEPVEHFCILLKGVIGFWYPVANAPPLLCELRNAPTFFNHAELIGRFAATATVTTLAPSQILRVDRDTIASAIRQSQNLWQILMYESARRVERVSFVLRTAALEDPTQRVAKFFIELMSAFGLPTEGGTLIRKACTQEEIADMLGLHRRSVIRALQSIACINKRGDQYIVTDAVALAQHAEGTASKR